MSNEHTFTFLNSIHEGNTDLIESGQLTERDYNPYFINRFLSSNLDTILYAQEMNQRYHISNHMQYDYLRNVVRKRRRKCSWGKKTKIDNIEHIKLYYNCSTKDAVRYLDILNKEQINTIKAACSAIKK
jgi:hypothetical protein